MDVVANILRHKCTPTFDVHILSNAVRIISPSPSIPNPIPVVAIRIIGFFQAVKINLNALFNNVAVPKHLFVYSHILFDSIVKFFYFSIWSWLAKNLLDLLIKHLYPCVYFFELSYRTLHHKTQGNIDASLNRIALIHFFLKRSGTKKQLQEIHLILGHSCVKQPDLYNKGSPFQTESDCSVFLSNPPPLPFLCRQNFSKMTG